ncbi:MULTISPECIES: UvrD-helicase domain-containing protein [Psychrilyobacter]|uniref:UvrD-like helicase ATP-binding domain-containing protein n=1 Tax=Psychrilyobacter piezotolerans TaxID=2293438 RepID=A0ABX9KIY7_9FUSO|nr:MULTISPECIES: UvrD-helicase domain-containing protein [Psychrilyobacter]MCS5421726.1 AAA family ATPase [Psychrilyobacter sp. S5]NDI77161.1 AAA family ATPase [Psychrilyobacter piezotolerans]RDE64153.1 hypothetical protein DV867_04280 [Psychrilyobacter sp. S5]REI42245.1 hypothetical protein DYH56_04280 [Psychrilyobacter piezotolerans]
MLKSRLRLLKKKEETPNGIIKEGVNFYPASYLKLPLSKIEREILKTVNNLSVKSKVFVNLNAISDEEIHVILSKSKILCLIPIAMDNLEKFLKLRELIYNDQIKKFRKNIKNRLLDHRALRKDETELKFALEVKFIFKSESVKNLRRNNFKFKNEEKCYLDDNVLLNEELKKEILLSKKSKEMTEEDHNNIIHLLAPEYVIPKAKENKNIPTIVENPKDIDITSFLLDSSQIDIINDIKLGNSLILASAGSGKSVILFSKALKIAAKNPDKEVLVLCFNKNLASYYEWKISISGFRVRNLKCLTFHKFLENILSENVMSVRFRKKDDEYWTKVFERARQLVKTSNTLKKYFGIFIDEIQIFKPEWYKFCIDMLEDLDKNYLSICGDVSQNVNKNIKAGIAPWQGKGLPNYRGRSIRLNKNYRNTKEITNYMNSFINKVKKSIEQYSIEVENQNEMYVLGESLYSGDKVRYFESSRLNVIDKIIEEIEYYNEVKKIPLQEIAVLFPYRQYGLKKYYIDYWLENKLKEKYIDFTSIISSGNNLGKYYSQIEGVVLSTIESSLGLDFDAVILTGLLPLGEYKKSKQLARKRKITEEVKEEFLDAVNKIYTGCTRARKNLSIISDVSSTESDYVKFIKESI